MRKNLERTSLQNFRSILPALLSFNLSFIFAEPRLIGPLARFTDCSRQPISKTAFFLDRQPIWTIARWLRTPEKGKIAGLDNVYSLRVQGGVTGRWPVACLTRTSMPRYRMTVHLRAVRRLVTFRLRCRSPDDWIELPN